MVAFYTQPIYRHGFILNYNSTSENGYGACHYGAGNHALTLIIDKKDSNVNVLILESNNLYEFAIKQIIFDIVNLFCNIANDQFNDESLKTLQNCAANPFQVWIKEPIKDLPSFTSLVESYKQAKENLVAKIDRNDLHNALYFLEKIKQIYLKTLRLEESQLSKEIIKILNHHKILGALDISQQEIKEKFRYLEIELHQAFDQLEQKELDDNLEDYIIIKDLGKIKQALAAGANLKAIDFSDNPIMGSITSNREILEYFIELGIDIETQNSDGETPLMIAIMYNELELVKIFLAHNANPNARDHKGCTPLMYAAPTFCSNQFDMVKLLIEHKADVHAKDELGQPVINYFLKQSIDLNIIKYLRDEHNAKIDLATLFSDKPTSIGSISIDLRLNAESLDFLIKNLGLAINHPNGLGFKLVQQAIKQNRENLVDRLFENDFGLTPNMQDEANRTPLMYAAKEQSFEVFKHLIEKYHADTKIKNKEGKTAIDIATEHFNYYQGVEYLKNLNL